MTYPFSQEGLEEGRRGGEKMEGQLPEGRGW